MVQKTDALDIRNLTFEVGPFTVTGAGGAATLHRVSGKITTEALATAADATHTLTLTNSHIAASDIVFVTLARGTLTTGDPVLGTVTPAAGSCVILIENVSAAAAFNGTLVVSYWVFKA